MKILLNCGLKLEFDKRQESLKKQESGFTLMELLIVLALVAVISMIAVPIYRSYMQGAKITEGLTLASSIQLDAEVYYMLNNQWPSEDVDTAHSQLKLGTPENYAGNSVESISISGKTITVLYNSDEVVGESGEADVKLLLTADVAEGGNVIRWQCEGENIPEADLPTSCEPKGA